MELFLILIYIVILGFTGVRILLDTESTPKTLAYLLLILVFPIAGVIFYFSFGINYRHQKSNDEGRKAQVDLDASFLEEIPDETESLLQSFSNEIGHFQPLISFIKGVGSEQLSRNGFHLLINGEEKFPEVLKVLEQAQDFIHMEYYAWENDTRGNQIKDVLLKKAQEGIKIRVLYDDYASRLIKKNIVRELKAGGVEIYPKIKLKIRQLANRINHRDHRKIIIVDGQIGFVGGINISDRYDNSIDTKLYWRDTHVKICGRLVTNLQRHFIVSWNASSAQELDFDPKLFPRVELRDSEINGLGQIVAGGPIYPKSGIMMTYSRLFSMARQNLYVTNPYFIPNEAIMNSLMQAGISGVDVRLMVPKKSDSAIVGAASRFYFQQLLDAGVRIFLYKKGFVHAKTVVADGRLSVVGTANMDIRSFDLNFEIMSVIYSEEFATDLTKAFRDDLEECEEIDGEAWRQISVLKKLTYAIARLISSFL